MVASAAAMLKLVNGLWFDGELYKFHRWFHMIYILIMQLRGRGWFGPTKTAIVERYHPSVLKFYLTWTAHNISNKMTKFYDDVYSFERVRGCWFVKLYISMFGKWLESPQRWGGWGCEVSCCGHHRQRGKTTTGSDLDGAVLDFTQILAYLVHNMSRSQLYLGFGQFGWLPSSFGH